MPLFECPISVEEATEFNSFFVQDPIPVQKLESLNAAIRQKKQRKTMFKVQTVARKQFAPPTKRPGPLQPKTQNGQTTPNMTTNQQTYQFHGQTSQNMANQQTYQYQGQTSQNMANQQTYQFHGHTSQIMANQQTYQFQGQTSQNMANQQTYQLREDKFVDNYDLMTTLRAIHHDSCTGERRGVPKETKLATGFFKLDTRGRVIRKNDSELTKEQLEIKKIVFA